MDEKTATGESDLHTLSNGADTLEEGDLDEFDPSVAMTSAIAWIEENQTLAMLGAFALGVFIGVMMRD